MEKRLFRSQKDKIIFGLCGGIGEYCNCDPTWIRLGFALLTLFGGGGVIIYLVASLIVPKEV